VAANLSAAGRGRDSDSGHRPPTGGLRLLGSLGWLGGGQRPSPATDPHATCSNDARSPSIYRSLLVQPVICVQLAEEAEAVAPVRGVSLNALVVDSLRAEIERVRADKNFTSRARKLLARDKELLDRLAR
jgi:hypothetical protein